LETTILFNPYIACIILLVLSLGDVILGNLSHKQYEKYTASIFMYETSLAKSLTRSKTANIMAIITKVIPPFLLFIIWQMASGDSGKTTLNLYWLLLGFALSMYLIIDLRHLESMSFAILIKKARNGIEGKLLIKRYFSLSQSAIQIATILLILLAVFSIEQNPFFLGAALAPLTLIIRNLALLKS
jgi:hypothetical protein